MTREVRFRDDDQGYLDWLRDHPTGYVVNCHRKPRAHYLVLHRATCNRISGRPVVWTGAFIKFCADTTADLDAWAHTETGGYPSRCSFCSP